MNKPLTIEQRGQILVDPVLAACLHQRTINGIEKYGQRLDDNIQPDQAKAVHLVQELLDGVQYALWLGRMSTAKRLAAEANLIASEYQLTTAQIMAGGKQ